MTPEEKRNPLLTILWFTVGLLAVFVLIIAAFLIIGMLHPDTM